MNYINILIVDDDVNKISSIIKTIKEISNATFSFSNASCVMEALEYLKKNEYHLLITDLHMPLRHDDSPDNNGGDLLLRSIYRTRNKANVPLYIVGLTQYANLKNKLNSVWNVWYYDSSEEEWKIKLRDIIFHISLIKSRIVEDIIETIFVEGYTDKLYIQKAIHYYYPSIQDKIKVETLSYGAGASWVERQIFIWAKSLVSYAETNSYVKAVGVFDDDESGRKSIANLSHLLKDSRAELSTFSILKSSYKYSVELKSIKVKGISFSTTIEDLVSIDCLKIASENNWLEERNKNSIILDNEILDFSNSEISESVLLDKGFTMEEILLITKKIKDEYKTKYCSMVCDSHQVNIIHIKYLLDEILAKLKVGI